MFEQHGSVLCLFLKLSLDIHKALYLASNFLSIYVIVFKSPFFIKIDQMVNAFVLLLSMGLIRWTLTEIMNCSFVFISTSATGAFRYIVFEFRELFDGLNRVMRMLERLFPMLNHDGGLGLSILIFICLVDICDFLRRLELCLESSSMIWNAV